MLEKINIQRTIYGKNTFQNAIDTEFKQLIPKESTVQETKLVTVDSFFDEYDQIFYDIPLSGSKSHLEIINRSSDYLGVSFSELEEEIRNLRADNVFLRNQLLVLSQ